LTAARPGPGYGAFILAECDGLPRVKGAAGWEKPPGFGYQALWRGRRAKPASVMTGPRTDGLIMGDGRGLAMRMRGWSWWRIDKAQ
jgi:hypothetical protein